VYKKALKEGFTYALTTGVHNTQGLFGASDIALIEFEERLEKAVKRAKKGGRMGNVTIDLTTLKTKLRIVSDILDTRILERENKKSETIKKQEIQRLLNAKWRAEERKLTELSIEEIEKKIKKLQ